MRISDWSSDVCSSVLFWGRNAGRSRWLQNRTRSLPLYRRCRGCDYQWTGTRRFCDHRHGCAATERRENARPDRKSVVSGKSVSVRVDLGGRRTLNKKMTNTTNREETSQVIKTL